MSTARPNCFDYAAQYLPDGYSIEIELERDSGTAELIDPSGEILSDVKEHEESFEDFIYRLTDDAILDDEEQKKG